MRLPFRQGIAAAPPNFINLSNVGTANLSLALGETVVINFADGATNYAVTETRSIVNAWSGPFVRGRDYWLYWDIAPHTGQLTRGYTTVEPIVGPTEPANPVNRQHWFDTTRGIMFEYVTANLKWQRRIRVFAAKLFEGTQIVSMSANSPSFIGTQVGIVGDVTVGALVFDANGAAMRKSDGTFFTTEDVVTAGLGSNALVKLENSVLSAQAIQPISAYSVVRFVGDNKIALANNMMKDPGIYGVVEQDAAVGDTVTVVTEGVIRGDLWGSGWDAQTNDLIYVDANGELTLEPQPTQVVGIVVDRNSLLLTSMIVGNKTTIESEITIVGPGDGVIVTGTTGTKSTAFSVELAGDLAAVESLTTAGVVHRIGNDVWEAKPVDLSTDTSGVLPVARGGTGNASLTGYVRGSGSGPLQATTLIPGGDIAGDIVGNAANVTGVVDVSHGGTGASTAQQALTNLLPMLPPNVAEHTLVSDGNAVIWKPLNAGTVTSVDVRTGGAGLVVGSAGPVTTSGAFDINLTGPVRSLAEVTTSGITSVSPAGHVSTHTLISPTYTIAIENGDAATPGPIQLSLAGTGSQGEYARVTVDGYGRVVAGQNTLNWSHIDPESIPVTASGLGLVDVYTKADVAALTWDWTSVTGTPTTLAGYGITNAYNKQETEALSWDWSKILNTPTTLDGYNITDSVKNAGGATSIAVGASINKPGAGESGRLYVDTTTNSLSLDTGIAWVDVGSGGTVTAVGVTSSSPGLQVDGTTVTSSGTFNLSLTGNVGYIDQLTSTGFAVRNNAGAWNTRALLGTYGSIEVSNTVGEDDVIIDLANVGTAGTYYRVTTDGKGRVVYGESTLEVPWSSLTNTPTTASGYGLTDVVTSATVGQPNGVAALDGTGKIPTSQLPALAVTDVHVVSSVAEMVALNAQEGDVAIRTDVQKTFILTNNIPADENNWHEFTSSNGAGVVSYVDMLSDTDNIVVQGGPVIDSGTFRLGLAGNLAEVAGVATSGVLKKTGSVWTAGQINGSQDISGTISVENGGTGASSLAGYIKGNATSPFTASLTIPGSDISGDIAGNAANVNGVVPISNGGTGAVTATQALNNILPPQVGTGYLYTSGGTPSWSSTVAGSDVSGAVDTAANALSLGGILAASYPLVTGVGATGTWDISIQGSAAKLGGEDASNYPLADGTRASGTWNIDITGSAAAVGGIPATDIARTDGSNATGTWPISIIGTAAGVSGTIPVTNGGTGATTAADALQALLPTQTAQDAGKALTTNGTTAVWATPSVSFSALTQTPSTLMGYGIVDAQPLIVPAAVQQQHKFYRGDKIWDTVTATHTEVSQTAHGFTVGTVVAQSGSGLIAAKADTPATAEVVGIVASVIDANTFILQTSGRVTSVDGLAAGVTYYLSSTDAGKLTPDEPTTIGHISKPVLVAQAPTAAWMINAKGTTIVGNVAATGSFTNADLVDGVYTFTHNLGDTHPFVQTYDNNGVLNRADLVIKAVSSTQVTVDCSAVALPLIGTWYIKVRV